ncbi:MAG TPA: hypothetical protein VJ476_04425 [Rhizomicrobium sp.]|nr:hypothetical protein [Rhizomicrobium sp.]
MSIIDPAAILAGLIYESLKRIRVRVGAAGLEVEFRPSEETIDKRLARISAARENLIEALEAVDELESAAKKNKRDLEQLNSALAEAEKQKGDVHAQLNALKQIAVLDGGAVRKSLGLPTTLDIWRDRTIAFASGVLASLLAAWLWKALIHG